MMSQFRRFLKFRNTKWGRHLYVFILSIVAYVVVSAIVNWINPYWRTLSYTDGQVAYRASISEDMVRRIDSFFKDTGMYRRYDIQRVGYERGLYHVGVIQALDYRDENNPFEAGQRLAGCMAYEVFGEAIEVHFIEPRNRDNMNARYEIIMVEPDRKAC